MSKRRDGPAADLSAEFTLDELSVELKDATSQVSSQIRSINLGVLALSWTLLLKGDDVQNLVGKIPDRALLAVAACSLLSIVADLCHYVAFAQLADSTFDRAAVSETKTAGYSPDTFIYRAMRLFYRAKILLAVVAAGAFISLIAFALLA